VTDKPIALVTGAGRRRVGQAVARHLAQQGYALAIHYRSARQEAEQFCHECQLGGIPATAFAADLADLGQTERLAKAVLDHFGRIDVLVHCASRWQACALEHLTAEAIVGDWNIHAGSALLLGKHVGLAMTRQAQGGCIVFLGDWAIVRPYRDYPSYLASKGAIPTITRLLAVELGTRHPKVRVNAILPGPVLPPEEMTQEQIHQLEKSTLVGRVGSADEVAQAVVFFLTNAFLTGVCLPLDGGRTIYAGA